jgi:hypothetical protein
MIQAAGFEKGRMVPVMGGSLIAGAVQCHRVTAGDSRHGFVVHGMGCSIAAACGIAPAVLAIEKGSMVPVIGGSLIAGAVQRRTGCSCSLG